MTDAYETLKIEREGDLTWLHGRVRARFSCRT
jgi:hypothetical protein